MANQFSPKALVFVQDYHVRMLRDLLLQDTPETIAALALALTNLHDLMLEGTPLFMIHQIKDLSNEVASRLKNTTTFRLCSDKRQEWLVGFVERLITDPTQSIKVVVSIAEIMDGHNEEST